MQKIQIYGLYFFVFLVHKKNNTNTQTDTETQCETHRCLLCDVFVALACEMYSVFGKLFCVRIHWKKH